MCRSFLHIDNQRADENCSFTVSYPVYLGASFDASTTNLTYHIPHLSGLKEPLEITLSFLSPITPTSTLRQALPAAYLTVFASGTFDVNVYVDVNGDWVSGNSENEIKWEFGRSSAQENNETSLKTWKITRIIEQILTETEDRAEWGTLHFLGPPDVQHGSGPAGALRQQFARMGTLQNTVDRSFRKIMDNEPAFAFSKSFILKNSTEPASVSSDSVLFTIGHTQDPVTKFASLRGVTLMRPLWASWFGSASAMMEYHYLDFNTASKLATNYSQQLAKDALKSGSEDYKDIVALSARQVLGATSFSGVPENPILFLKEISSNGDFQTVDVIFPAFPFFLYTNSVWLAYLLEPLLEYQLSGQYPNQYSLHDMGVFPNGTGYPDGNDEYMPVEECGNMLIMALAIVNSLKYDTKPANILTQLQIPFNEDSDNIFPLNVGPYGLDQILTTDGKKQAQRWIRKSYKIWKQWTGYLVEFSLIPENQLSTDDFAGWLANQTNLALKGIIGIRAMSEIADTLGEVEDATNYRNISDVYVKKWEEYGMARDGTYAKLAYTWYGSWTTLYNLFTDAVLCFHLPSTSPTFTNNQLRSKGSSRTAFVSENVYKAQSHWYSVVRQKYGLPLDSRHQYTKSDWEFFAAAVASQMTRGKIVHSIATWLNETSTGKRHFRPVGWY